MKYHFAGGLLKRGGLVNFPVSEGDGQVLDGSDACLVYEDLHSFEINGHGKNDINWKLVLL